MDERISFIKEVIEGEVKSAGYSVYDIILFGSRIRGGAGKKSDWDFIVVVDGSPDRKEK